MKNLRDTTLKPTNKIKAFIRISKRNIPHEEETKPFNQYEVIARNVFHFEFFFCRSCISLISLNVQIHVQGPMQYQVCKSMQCKKKLEVSQCSSTSPKLQIKDRFPESRI